ncbi:MAG: hypothetical protein WA880_04205, partial [Ornithinimicrobium sp.]
MTTTTETPPITGRAASACGPLGADAAGSDFDGGGGRYAEIVAEHEARWAHAGGFEDGDCGVDAADWRDVEATVGVVSALWDVEAGLARLPLPPGVGDALRAVIRCGV